MNLMSVNPLRLPNAALEPADEPVCCENCGTRHDLIACLACGEPVCEDCAVDNLCPEDAQ